ncbi:MAG: GldG family protein [Deltaproteobacteria bacterium]|jgi:hypothetical protein|nr:GldG family protein [Deltaproteobacteria bacterium]
MPSPAPKGPGNGPWGPLGLFFLFLALLGLALAPGIPGFWALPLALSLIILPLKGPRAILRDLRDFFGPRNRGALKVALSLAMALAIVLAAGSARFLPALNLAAPEEALLPPETHGLLARLTVPVSLRARLGRETARGPVTHLMDLYGKASGRVTATVELAEGLSETQDGEVSVVRPDSVLIEAEGFSETVSPITRFAIDRSLRRLMSPNRLAYNLMGHGVKSVLDESPSGLSLWARSLMGEKIFLLDLAWQGGPLPPEAFMAGALVLAGPRAPMGGDAERALIDYVAGGGKLLILQDPMVAGFDPGALSALGLDIPRGLVVDPEDAWAGTQDRFIVSRDFPAHPITLGLERPVVWPLSGAVTLAKAPASEAEAEVPLLRLGEGPGPQAPEPEAPGPVRDAAQGLLYHTWAVALSSDASWLETDLGSIADGDHRYQPAEDASGPLVLSTATSVKGGGRLALVADADLAANGFINYGDNRAFLTNALFWLMGAEDDLPTTARRGIALTINHRRAQLLFWIPTVFWPLLALFVWYLNYRRRRRPAP